MTFKETIEKNLIDLNKVVRLILQLEKQDVLVEFNQIEKKDCDCVKVVFYKGFKTGNCKMFMTLIRENFKLSEMLKDAELLKLDSRIVSQHLCDNLDKKGLEIILNCQLVEFVMVVNTMMYSNDGIDISNKE